MPHLIGDLSVSRETYEKLRSFEALVLKWSKSINLVSKDSLADLWTRHICDSAQMWPIIGHHPGPYVDIGSGGGFPGVVLALFRAEAHSGGPVTLIESDQRKATFLRTAFRECDIPGTVLAERVEKAPPQQAKVLTARALASLAELLPFAEQHMSKEGVALFPKGRNYQTEIEAAQDQWGFDITCHDSLTAPDACIIELRNIRRADA